LIKGGGVITGILLNLCLIHYQNQSNVVLLALSTSSTNQEIFAGTDIEVAAYVYINCQQF